MPLSFRAIHRRLTQVQRRCSLRSYIARSYIARSYIARSYTVQHCRGLYRRQPIWWVSLVALGLTWGARSLDLLEPLELLLYDRLIQLQGDQGPDDRLLIVEVTEADIRRQNQWPLSDGVLAEVLQRLQQHQPRSIGIDLYRDISHGPGELAFEHQLSRANVFGVTFLGDLESTYVAPPPTLPTDQIGFNDLVVDEDGVVRRNFLFTFLGDEQLYSFSLRLALDYLSQEPDWPPADYPAFQATETGLSLGDRNLPAIPPDAGGYHGADTVGYQILLKYRSQHQVARRITLSQLLANDFNPAWVQDRVVLIGVTAPSLNDMIDTPYSASIQNSHYQMPGVEVHAQMVSQVIAAVLDGQYLPRFWSNWQELAWCWGWAALGGLLGWRFKHPLSLGISGLVGVTSILGSAGLLIGQGWWVPIAMPVLGFSLASIVMVAYRGFYTTYHDPLTGLPNQQLFQRYLYQALRRNQANSASPSLTASSLALLFVDLDRFEAIHQSCGQRQADQVLLAIAQRLKQIYPAKLARLGRDEFAILLEDIAGTAQVIERVDQLQAELAQPIMVKGQEFFTTASVGIALGQQGYGYEPEALLRDAHTANYRAKALGQARYEVFSNGMRTQAIHRFQTETDLHHALERGEIFLNYQPLVDLRTGCIAGFEALARWQHPERGLVPPTEFISVAEETGMIIPLGLWILQTACEQAQRWQQLFPQLPPLLMSVNLSSKQFQQADLVSQIERTLKQTGLRGNQLKLELTESLVMGDVESAIQILLKLKALDIQLGLDDFGTGYSSLSYLHRLPLDTLKVDRSFVVQMEEASENREIIKTIVALGHNLRLDIIAEGVETEVQAQQLRSLHCQYGQGYFFAKPLNTDAATTILRQYQLWDGASEIA